MVTHNPDALLDALDPDQRKVALQVGGPLAVRAGAGTGKTRAITYRIAYGAAVGAFDPANVLAVTFTARAAAEMRSRLAGLGVPAAQARTFHSAALRQLSYFWPTVVGGPVPTLIEHKASLVAAAAARTGVKIDKALVRDMAAEIEWAKVSMVDAENYAHRIAQIGRPTPGGLSVDEVTRLMDAYEDAKEERAGIDFEDVLLTLCGILQERDDIARKIRSQYRSFVVDEYQDVSRLQQHLLNLWLGGRHDICVVGDVAQTIYSFAGASPKFLLDFAAQHRGANIVELNRDYRSTPQIVEAANTLMAASPSQQSTGDSGRVHLVSQRPSGAQVTYRAHADDGAEAAHIASSIADMVAKGRALQEIAILYRTNSQSEVFEQALAQAGIAYVVRGGARFFEREEIRKALLALRRLAQDAQVAADSNDEASFLDRVRAALEMAGWTQEAPEGSGAVRERWDNLNALWELAKDNPDRSLEAFNAELDERVRAQAAPAIAGVTLTTLHAAKGLEWEVVFLAGVSEGLIPISHASTDAGREEERRLLYVGITRAKDILEVSWARARSGGSGRANRKRSRFLDALWPKEDGNANGRGAAHGVRTSKRAAAKAEAATFEAENSPNVLELFVRLKEWRLGEAQDAGVPAFAVFTDRTLRSIAIAQPKTLTQLRVISGVGEVKLDRFGAAVLAVIRQHGQQQGTAR